MNEGLILRLVAERFGVSVAQIKGERRTRQIALARHVAMYLMQDLLSMNGSEIAWAVNRKNHSTALWAIRRVEKDIDQDRQFGRDIQAIRREAKRAWRRSLADA